MLRFVEKADVFQKRSRGRLDPGSHPVSGDIHIIYFLRANYGKTIRG